MYLHHYDVHQAHCVFRISATETCEFPETLPISAFSAIRGTISSVL